MDRLRRLKEASGLTWAGLADVIGVDKNWLRRSHRKGVEPSGRPMLSLVCLAILMGEGFKMVLLEEDQHEN